MGNLVPLKGSLLHALGDGARGGAKPFDEPPIEWCQAMEAANFGDGGKSRL